ncbi:hypothetical protein MKS88_000567 [Plasmodium brasilianum]|uniref:Uncharacterized protein n=1 Tax=Plasmodium brasilianum TaxID=5824 RepID=A0ACB9YG86_PLABR|nr:hypothetical protein MKS88_000567 [Plasmodium brasilianum]
MIQTNKVSFINIVSFTILIWISQCSYESTTSGKSWNKNIILYNVSDARVNRILIGETDVNFRQNYSFLKEKAMHLLDEDDDIFANKLNALIQNGDFQENYKKEMYDSNFEIPLNSFKYIDNNYDSYDSLKESEYGEKKEPIKMKKFYSRRKKKSSLSKSFLKSLDEKYENCVAELRDTKCKRTRKFTDKFELSMFTNMFIALNPILISGFLMIMFLISKSSGGILFSVALFLASVVYVIYKFFKINGE